MPRCRVGLRQRAVETNAGQTLKRSFPLSCCSGFGQRGTCTNGPDKSGADQISRHQTGTTCPPQSRQTQRQIQTELQPASSQWSLRLCYMNKWMKAVRTRKSGTTRRPPPAALAKRDWLMNLNFKSKTWISAKMWQLLIECIYFSDIDMSLVVGIDFAVVSHDINW